MYHAYDNTHVWRIPGFAIIWGSPDGGSTKAISFFIGKLCLTFCVGWADHDDDDDESYWS